MCDLRINVTELKISVNSELLETGHKKAYIVKTCDNFSIKTNFAVESLFEGVKIYLDNITSIL